MQRAGAPGKIPWPPYCPGTGSGRCATTASSRAKSGSVIPARWYASGTGCNSPSHHVTKAPSGQVRNTAELVNRPPGRPATRTGHSYLQSPVRLAQPGQTTGMTVDQCHNLPLHLCPQPVLRCNTKICLRLCGGIRAGKIPVSLRRSHHEAARLRRRTPPGMRESLDSVCVIKWDLLRKFINGKRKIAEISHHAAQLTPAHALAAFVLTDICGGFIELIRHCRTVIPAFISPVIPHTGIRQA